MFENLNENVIYRIYEDKKLDKDCNSPHKEKDFFDICLDGAKKLSKNDEALEQLNDVFLDIEHTDEAEKFRFKKKFEIYRQA